jgi:hypothetical protein
MKVLHVIPSVSAVYGEPSELIVDIERAPAERGIEVTTVTTNDDGDHQMLPVQRGWPFVTHRMQRDGTFLDPRYFLRFPSASVSG